VIGGGVETGVTWVTGVVVLKVVDLDGAGTVPVLKVIVLVGAGVLTAGLDELFLNEIDWDGFATDPDLKEIVLVGVAAELFTLKVAIYFFTFLSLCNAVWRSLSICSLVFRARSCRDLSSIRDHFDY